MQEEKPAFSSATLASEVELPPSLGLAELPLEILEAVCRHLGLRDRVSLTSCCSSLWARSDITGSTVLWGEVDVTKQSQAPRIDRSTSLAVWLGRHRGGVRALRLQGQGLGSGEELLRGLLGGPLVALQLSNNSGIGAEAERGFLQLRQLRALTRLEIVACRLRRLPSQVLALHTLRRLSLHGNCVLWQGGAAAWAPLQHLGATLTSLAIGGGGLVRLPPQLSALTGLEELEAGMSSWGQGGEGALRPLRRLTSLRRLDLSSSGLAWLPPQHFAPLSYLEELNLNGNGPLGVAGQDALRALGALPGLTRLSLCGCRLREVPPLLAELPALASLALSSNDLPPVPAAPGLSALGKLMALTRLELSWAGVAALPPQLAELPALADLEVRGLGIGGGGPADETWVSLPLLTALTRLDVGWCGSGFGAKQSPAAAALAAAAGRGVCVVGPTLLGDIANAFKRDWARINGN